MKKLIDFKELHDDVQDYADRKCGENFTYAVRQLIARALLQELKNGGGIDDIPAAISGGVIAK